VIHLDDEGAFSEAYLSDDHLLDPTQWAPTSLELRSYPDAERAKFSLRLIGNGQNMVTMFADDELLRDLRQAINVALGEG
jgi:hypothetical protein